MKIYEIKAKSILHKTKIPGADYAINHYSGCSHACIYCYARFVCRWRKQKEKWGEFVDVKVNAAELAEKESKGKKGSILLCTTGDPYQPIEREYQLTRKILQVLNPEMEVSILTKSNLILKDMYLFSRFKDFDAGLTITTMNESVKKIFEPKSSSSNERIDALKKLKENGFKTYCFVGPILPYLTNLEEIIKQTFQFVDLFMFEDLNMDAARKSIMDTIRENFPELEEKYQTPSKGYWLEKEKEIKKLGKKYKKPVKIYLKHTGSLKF